MRIVLSPYDDLEEKLTEWVLDLRNNDLVITRTNIRQQALQIAKETGQTNFKASADWCTRYMHRNNLALRQKTHIVKKLLKDVDGKVDSFLKYVIDLRKNYGFSLADIGNMDETPMFFDMVGNWTVDVKGKSTINVKTTGSNKAHFTTILACLADGTKLKPAVVFKRKTFPKEKLPPNIVVYVQEKGWVDETVLTKWLNGVWFKRPGALLKRKSLLVWDMFRAHLLRNVKDTLKNNKTYQAVIPGGCTSVLQPLDVCLNKPFKVNMRQKWNYWMVNIEKQMTKACNIRRPDLKTVCEWVIDAWNEIPTDMVAKSFLKCGISNSMDGTEDDELYSDFVCSRGGEGSFNVVDEYHDSDSDDEDMYDEKITTKELEQLFGESDDKEFNGF